MAGMLAGAATLILWEEFGPAELYELVPAFAAGLVVTVVVSLLTPKPAESDWREFMGEEVAVPPKP